MCEAGQKPAKTAGWQTESLQAHCSPSGRINRPRCQVPVPVAVQLGRASDCYRPSLPHQNMQQCLFSSRSCIHKLNHNFKSKWCLSWWFRVEVVPEDPFIASPAVPSFVETPSSICLACESCIRAPHLQPLVLGNTHTDMYIKIDIFIHIYIYIYTHV